MKIVHNDWLRDDIGGVPTNRAGRARSLDKEIGAAAGDWLRAGPGWPGKGRRRNLSRKSGCEAAVRRWQRLSWSRRPRRLSTSENRMRVRFGLTLLLCTVLLSSAAASSGQYRASGGRPRATAPQPRWRQGRGARWSLVTPRPVCHSLLLWASVIPGQRGCLGSWT